MCAGLIMISFQTSTIRCWRWCLQLAYDSGGDDGVSYGPSLTDPPSDVICQVATMLSWTRDPFDRLIWAQAVTAEATLVTKDQSIRRNLPLAWWPGDEEN
jgi:hypothetical protein